MAIYDFNVWTTETDSVKQTLSFGSFGIDRNGKTYAGNISNNPRACTNRVIIKLSLSFGGNVSPYKFGVSIDPGVTITNYDVSIRIYPDLSGLTDSDAASKLEEYNKITFCIPTIRADNHTVDLVVTCMEEKPIGTIPVKCEVVY